MLAMLLFKSDVQVCMYKADSLRAFVVSVNNTFVFFFLNGGWRGMLMGSQIVTILMCMNTLGIFKVFTLRITCTSIQISSSATFSGSTHSFSVLLANSVTFATQSSEVDGCSPCFTNKVPVTLPGSQLGRRGQGVDPVLCGSGDFPQD